MHGEPNYKDPGPFSKKIGKNIVIVRSILPSMDTSPKEGTIFMDLSVLFYEFISSILSIS